MNKDIILLIDYRDQFYFSTKYRGASVDVVKLKKKFQDLGFSLVIKHFYEIDLRAENYKNKYILYQSSEDPALFYKDYIEDILLGMKIQGAHLIPDFKYFRAHHNKVFMEILRDILEIKEIQNIQSKAFGTYEEYVKSDYVKNENSFVIKPGSGARSRNVGLINKYSDRKKIPFKISRSFTFDNLKLFISKLKSGKPFTPMSNNRKKFIIQNYIGDLKGDYRVIVYGKKYYTVFRKNRKNDFRASGSGMFESDPKIPPGLFEYSQLIYRKMDVPYMTLDVAVKDGVFYLFEFQCLCLGQLFFEKSKHYYKQEENGEWKKYIEEPDLEREISETVSAYIKEKNVWSSWFC